MVAILLRKQKLAALMGSTKLPELAVVGDPAAPETIALIDALRRGRQPFGVVAHRPPGESGDRAAGIVPLLQERATTAPFRANAAAVAFARGGGVPQRPDVVDRRPRALHRGG